MIRRPLSEISHFFGESYLNRLKMFSGVVGYGLDIDDEVKVELNPDRLDLASFHSLERAMNLYYEGRESPLTLTWTDMQLLHVGKDALGLRPFILCFVAEGSSLGEKVQDLIDFQERIHSSIGKDRKKVSIGLHDMDKIHPPLTYVTARQEELSFTTYDGFQGTIREIISGHPKGMLYGVLIGSSDLAPVILDSEGSVLSVPPIVNGNHSLVDPGTSKLFVDITGTDFRALRDSFYLLAGELSSYGFTISVPYLDIPRSRKRHLMAFHNRSVRVSRREIKEVLGREAVSADPVPALARMGLSAIPEGGGFIVTVPGNRIDIMGAVDIIEDYAKSSGFDAIPELEPQIATAGEVLASTRKAETLRGLGIGMGFQEIMTFVVTSSKHYNNREYSGGVSIINPKSVDNSVIRDRLYLNTLEFFSNNKNRGYPQRVFEIGKVVVNTEEEPRLCFGLTGSRASINDARKYAEYVLSRVSRTSISYQPATSGDFIDGRYVLVSLGSVEAGFMGEVHPSVLQEFDLQMPVAFVEFRVDKLMQHTP